jgi:hypothetical protein
MENECGSMICSNIECERKRTDFNDYYDKHFDEFIEKFYGVKLYLYQKILLKYFYRRKK